MGGPSKIILGNWKMHFSVKQAVAFAAKLAAKPIPQGVEVGILPNSLALNEIATILQNSELKVGAQNAYFQDEGAFTGEISMPMLRGIAHYVLIGHSERRHIFHESDDVTKVKVAAAIRSGITPVLCIGETLVQRQHYHTNQILSDQLTAGLNDLTAEEITRVVIAYEPVWAIGTGEFATPDEVSTAITKIRNEVASLYGSGVAEKVRILYGGSVSADNAASYLRQEGIDGLLVGGASLSTATFWPIVTAAGKTIPTKITVKK
jgi:triosephosphate isomerase